MWRSVNRTHLSIYRSIILAFYLSFCLFSVIFHRLVSLLLCVFCLSSQCWHAAAALALISADFRLNTLLSHILSDLCEPSHTHRWSPGPLADLNTCSIASPVQFVVRIIFSFFRRTSESKVWDIAFSQSLDLYYENVTPLLNFDVRMLILKTI